MNRREVLKILGLSGAFFATRKYSHANVPEKNQAIVLSTWYNQSTSANRAAWEVLTKKGSALDAVQQGVMVSENDWGNCCVGLGGNPDRDGYVTLDASIMNHMGQCGSVAFLEGIKNPIKVARAVMEKTPHVMLVGAGAQQFAVQQGFPIEKEELSPHAAEAYEKWLEKSEYKPQINIERGEQASPTDVPTKIDDEWNHDTIGMIAMDAAGNLSGACTTSGMGFKMRGRVGDSPIIGAGLYVDNEVGAATATGHGEEVIRICGSFLVVEYMRQGYTPENACKKAVERILKITPRKPEEIQIGFIALNKKGEYGGYALQKNFDFGVQSTRLDNIKVDANYLLK